MKKILISLVTVIALTASTSAFTQNAEKTNQEAPKKEACCKTQKEEGCNAEKKKKEGCDAEKKEKAAKEKGCCKKKNTEGESKSCGKK
ncbi:MAG: hypothetical protein FWF52_01515 [Candidatus Azobacteroides sp.]|nr:hypothetical protein [Candidatus Azobacteroides sp.]